MRTNHPMRWITILAALCLATGSWGANRLDMFSRDLGDPENAYDDWYVVTHPFFSEAFLPIQITLFVDRNFNAMDPATNPNAVSTFEILHGVRKSCQAWTDVSCAAVEFDDGVIPFDHSIPRFPNQVIVPGTIGLDGWNLVTFQDSTLALGAGVLGMSSGWYFYRDFDLGSFIELPPGVLIADPPGTPPPGGGNPQQLLIDFDGDGYSDVLIPSRDYKAGETIEADVWLNQTSAWNQWPDDPEDLTSGTVPITRPDTAGSLDIEGTVTHEFGHHIGIAHTNIELATMYFLQKGHWDTGILYPTDVWDNRTLDLDDEVAAALIYPEPDSGRGTIAGRVMDGNNFDGVPNYTSGICDAALYGTLYVTRHMTTGTWPIMVPDRNLLTSGTSVSLGVTQEDFDTSAALWVELLVEIQTGENIRLAIWPNPMSVVQPAPVLTTGGQQVHIEASPEFVIPGLPPFEQYLLWLDNAGVYRNDSAGVATSNMNGAFDFFFGYQTIPSEYYGGTTGRLERRIVGPDSPLPLAIVSTTPLTMQGDDPTSYVYVPVFAGQVTGGIDIYTNVGGLPPGVTPTPVPGAIPTPSPVGDTSFTPDSYGDQFVPTEQEWGVGAAAGDVDNDGDIDIYICNSVSAETTGSAISLVNRLLINTLVERQPDGTLVRDPGGPRFLDLTFGRNRQQGDWDDQLPFNIDMSFSARMADFNNDGWLDIYVSNSGSIDQGTINDAYNRMYINRGSEGLEWAGYFKDVTTEFRTDPGLGIPLTYTETIMPGIVNLPILGLADLSTKSDVGDLDSDGDIDIVVSNVTLFTSTLGVVAYVGTTAGPSALMGYISERILINHMNDINPLTRGFYFTDETLGMDGLVFQLLGMGAAFGELTDTGSPAELAIAADRLPPLYPDFLTTTGDESDEGVTYEVIVAPFVGNSSLDIFVLNQLGGDGAKSGSEMLYENADVDGDGSADGYFRLCNYGWDYRLSPWITSGTLGFLDFATLTETGIGGMPIADGDPGDITNPDERNLINVLNNSTFGGTAVDANYHGYPMLITLDGLGTNNMYDYPGQAHGRGEALRGGDPSALGSFSGWGVTYGWESWWSRWIPTPQYRVAQTLTTNIGTTPSLGRSIEAADYDHDGDFDLYVAYSKDRGEGILGGLPVLNDFQQSNGHAAFTNRTIFVTSGTQRATYEVVALDADLDGDDDVFQVNSGDQDTIVFNRLYIAPPDTNSTGDNPMFYEATAQFLPPYYLASTAPPYAGSIANMTINSVPVDINGDDLIDLAMANGALFTGIGDSTLLLINKGIQRHAGSPVLSPPDASFPGPSVPTYFSLLSAALGGTELPGTGRGHLFENYFEDTNVPGFDVIAVDLDLDSDYDIVLSSLGMGPYAFENVDSDDLVGLFDTLLPFGFTRLQWSRFLNSIPDQDFLGDGILIPSTSFFIPHTLTVERLVDPGGFNPAKQKKEQNRRLAYGDVDADGAIDVVIANGLPLVGAPNVLLLNAAGDLPVGYLADVTESYLPVETRTHTSGTQVISWEEGYDDDTLDAALADFDNDGFLELIFLNLENGLTSSTRYLDNDGSGHFTDTQPAGMEGSSVGTWVIPPFGRRIPSCLVVADFDGKGDATEDLNGNGVLDSGEDKNHNGQLDWWDSTETEDINGNGVLDPLEDGLAPFDLNGQLDSADLNGDGEITPRAPGRFDASWDLFIAFRDGPDKLFLNTLPGPPGTAFGLRDVSTTNLPQIMASSYGADAGDVDLDGDMDIVVAIGAFSSLSHIQLHLNDGRGGFRSVQEEAPANLSVLGPGAIDFFHGAASDIDLADLDGDGDLDIHLSYIGITNIAVTGGSLNVVFINRTIGDNFNTLNRLRAYRSPYIIKLSPQAAVQGVTLTASIMGQNLGDIAMIDLGPGVTVTAIHRLGPDTFSAVVHIADLAPVGTRNATVVNKEGKVSQLANAFTILERKTQAGRIWTKYK